jgi:hypothetical protein
MSAARPRPIRRHKVTIGFIDAAHRADHLEMLDYHTDQYRTCDINHYVFRCLVRNMVRRRRKLTGLVIGA